MDLKPATVPIQSTQVPAQRLTGRTRNAKDGPMTSPTNAIPPLRVCVFCGSSARVDERYRASATALGQLIAQRGDELVYGGGRVGLMGLVADAALSGGARVTGVIPRFLMNLEVGHGSVSELVITDSMHQRKADMYERADAFVVLPGGLGTLDETLEVLTWSQLQLSTKPVVLVDVAGYWQPLLALIDHTIASGFSRAENRNLFRVVETVDAVFDAINAFPAPSTDVSAKWL